MTKTLSYLKWKPAITPEKVFSDAVGLYEIKVSGDNIYWLESRPKEKGRVAIVRRNKLGKISDAIPKQYYCRTRVHEYGGGAYTVFKNEIYFVNFVDQRIYKQTLGKSKPKPLTPEANKDGSLGKYSCLEVSPDGKKLIFVYETEFENKENGNYIGSLDLTSKKIQEPKIIAKGNDFYSEPKFCPFCKKILYLAWNHPNMPWDSTELYVSDPDGKNKKKIAGGRGYAIFQPSWDSKANIYFVMDKSKESERSIKNWWNIYRYKKGKVELITDKHAEFGTPHWRFGYSKYSILSNDKIICSYEKDGREYLAVIDPETKGLTPLKCSLTSLNYLQTCGKNLYFIGASEHNTLAIYKYNIQKQKESVLKKSTTIKLKKGDISIPEHIEYPTLDKKIAHAYLYLPKNSKYKAPKNEKPPLILMAHGGPTSRAKIGLSLVQQFWTSQGYAVLDIDYRGSSGYGRKYRDELLGKWGIYDADDAAAGVKYLIKKKIIDPHKVAVRGGSAGGYLVQRVLTRHPDVFKTGASYFGIGNLITLVKDTHKFESRYVDNLVGAKLPKGLKRYKERSPKFHLDKLKAPTIIFQGSDDKIVTPENSREMAAVLKKKKILYEYYEYEGEAHGFRTKKNNVDSLKKEAAFYRKVFS